MSTVCPFVYGCQHPAECNDRRMCVLNMPPLQVLSDWRENPFPYPVRTDTAPRAVWPQGVAP